VSAMTSRGIAIELAREALEAYDTEAPYDAGWRLIPHSDEDWWACQAGVLSQSLRYLLASLPQEAGTS